MYNRFNNDGEIDNAGGGLNPSKNSLHKQLDREYAIPDIDSRIPLKVAYHRHFYALGEHYNSVAPIVKPCACCLEKTDS